MLVLTRKVGERIVIGDDITLTVLEVRPGGDIRIGVDAPSSVRVHRAEVLDAISAANTAAAQAGDETAAILRAALAPPAQQREQGGASEPPATGPKP